VDENKSQNDEENSTDNIETFMEKIFQEVNLKFNYPLERLTKQERLWLTCHKKATIIL